MAHWNTDLTSHEISGEGSHPEHHRVLAEAIEELREKVDAAEKTATWGKVENRPKTFATEPIREIPEIGFTGGTVQEAILALIPHLNLTEDAPDSE